MYGLSLLITVILTVLIALLPAQAESKPLHAVTAPASLVPDNIEPGETFYVIFVTSERFPAESTLSETYDNFVNKVADTAANKATNHPSLQWKALVATKDSQSLSHLLTQPADRPIYNLNGEKVADSFKQLLEGRLSARINYTESGQQAKSPVLVWTGLTKSGNKDPQFALGNKKSSMGAYIFTNNGVRKFRTLESYTHQRFYALSPLLINSAGSQNLLSATPLHANH